MYIIYLQVEAALSVSPYVDNIMLHADPFHSFCVALVVPSQHAVEGWASKQGIDTSDFAELCHKEEVVKEVQASLVKGSVFCHKFDFFSSYPIPTCFSSLVLHLLTHLPKTTRNTPLA